MLIPGRYSGLFELPGNIITFAAGAVGTIKRSLLIHWSDVTLAATRGDRLDILPSRAPSAG
jgi:hypothetical protein